MTADAPSELDIESVVKERYATGAKEQVAALCCPVNYDPKYLEAIPQEVIDRDYGCGDPSKHLRTGETVLDLGSGTGKICFIASQVVGAEGRVIGVDMTDDMLEVANRNAPLVAEKIGFSNVKFLKGRIQDLGLDLEELDRILEQTPVTNSQDLFDVQQQTEVLRRTKPLVADDSIDVVVSNCVLNLVASEEKAALFRELHRVLRRGGRAVISDIVADEDVPLEMQQDADLWSGCISGALTETKFLEAFEDAGFYGIRILEREQQPWQTVNGIEFRSVVVEAFKGKEGPCMEHNQAVIYQGPFKEVMDDDGHRMARGQRSAVCKKSFDILTGPAYEGMFLPIEPRQEITAGEATSFDCSHSVLRHPKETKGAGYSDTTDASDCCEETSCC